MLKTSTAVIVTVILCCIAYGVGNEAGEWYLSVLKSNGGVVLASDVVKYKYAGASCCILTLICCISFILQFGKK